jgi:hypothetical protein
MLFVPPETPARNCVGVATFTEAVIGEIAMLIPVTGSVHVEEEAVEDAVAAVVVQEIAVLGAAYLWQETWPNTAITNAKIGRRLTAPLSLTCRTPICLGSMANALSSKANYIPS